MQHLVAPSILACDFTRLGEAIQFINESDSDWIHFDVMDGRFVPNISFGIPILKAAKSVAEKPIDVHLMILEPERYIEDFCKAGADILTVHSEVSPNLHRTIQAIKESGMKAGVALNPHTPVSVLEDVINDLDMALVMSVNPGFGGQKFIPNTIKKVHQLKVMLNQACSSALIEVDGGVNLQNAPDLVKAGTDVLVAGSSVFKAENPADAVLQLKKLNAHTLKV